MLYPESLVRLSTGGAIGDVLFFSAVALPYSWAEEVTSSTGINGVWTRIYPTVLMWAAIMAFVFDVRFGMVTYHLAWGWMVCELHHDLLCFAVFYQTVFHRQTEVGVWCCLCRSVGMVFYGGWRLFLCMGKLSFKWCHYFLFMLAGAVCGLRMKEHGVETHHRGKNLCLLIVSILLFYGLQIAGTKQEAIAHLQVLTLIPLMGVTLGMYRLCCESWLIRLYNLNWMHRFMYSVSALCLEIYFVSGLVFNTSWNHWFPLNIFINLVLIVAMAYVVKVASN